MSETHRTIDQNVMKPELDLSCIDAIVERHGRGREAVIPVLQAIQQHYRYLPQDALKRVCELTEITPADVSGVSTFYTHFRHQPLGKHVVHVCQGTACHVKGSELVQDTITQQLGIPPGTDTDPDREFTVESVACLGCCTLAPVVEIDGATFGRVTPRTASGVLAEARRGVANQENVPQPSMDSHGDPVGEIRVGLGSCCQAQGSRAVHDEVRAVIAQANLPVHVKRVGCIGMCHQTPLVELVDAAGESKFFSHVEPDDVGDIVLKHFRPARLWQRTSRRVSRFLDRLYSNEFEDSTLANALDVRDQPVCAFLGSQKHIATECCGDIDPCDLDEYVRHDGFQALRRCLRENSPEAIIEEVRTSGLRGRGGAGFPTHLKWQKVREAKGDVKYMICNGDEGDPGAFMDRMLLESFPYRILEGMAIAAQAVGAHEAFLYIRAEYPLAVRRIRDAIRQCEDRGYAGKGILGSEFDLTFHVLEGAGAFVCGEETALINSVQGNRGTPTLRPPYPAESGLWGRPTLINNVETLACIPWIFRHGGQAFGDLGTEKSNGTKVFALAGKVQRGGLIEVPMGMSLQQIVDEIGGGVVPGREFKAVQVGGPSGGCVPAGLANTAVDFEALSSVGAIMGSGGLVVLDNTDCMVDIARYFLRFTQDQSCGKCTFCRVGTKRMLEILDRMCTGEGRQGDLEALQHLAESVVAGSICGLGKTAPNPVLSTLTHFRHEYEAHLDGKCPAGKCAPLVRYEITNDCIGCTLCAQHCPVTAIPMTPYRRHAIDLDLCTRCDTCRQVCPQDAVVVTS